MYPEIPSMKTMLLGRWCPGYKFMTPFLSRIYTGWLNHKEVRVNSFKIVAFHHGLQEKEMAIAKAPLKLATCLTQSILSPKTPVPIGKADLSTHSVAPTPQHNPETRFLPLLLPYPVHHQVLLALPPEQSPFRWIFSLYISPLKLVLLSLSFCGQFFTWMPTDLFDLSLLHLTFYFLFPSSWRTSSLILSFIEGLFVFFILCIKEYSTHNSPEPQTLKRSNFFLLILSQSSLLSFSAEIRCYKIFIGTCKVQASTSKHHA